MLLNLSRPALSFKNYTDFATDFRAYRCTDAKDVGLLFSCRKRLIPNVRCARSFLLIQTLNVFAECVKSGFILTSQMQS
jgi:hypothetical protein